MPDWPPACLLDESAALQNSRHNLGKPRAAQFRRNQRKMYIQTSKFELASIRVVVLYRSTRKMGVVLAFCISSFMGY